MIIKGRGRGNAEQLSAYLCDYLLAEKNDRAEVIQITKSPFRDLDRTFRMWEAESLGGRCQQPLWHAQLRTPKGENLTREQQIEAVDILEKHLGLVNQPRAIVVHEKDGHEHLHVVWSRIRRAEERIETKRRIGKRDKSEKVDSRPIRIDRRVMGIGTAKEMTFSKVRNAAAAREIEQRFGLQRVDDPEFKFDKSRSREDRREESNNAKQRDKQYDKRRHANAQRDDRMNTITAIWQQTDSGKALRAALLDAGYILARGDQRDFVVVDKGGDVHSLARQIRIKEVRKAEVSARLSDLDPASVPTVKTVQFELWKAAKEREATQAEQQPGTTIAAKEIGKDGARQEANSLDPATILEALTKQQSTFTKFDLHAEIRKRMGQQESERNPQQIAAIAKQVGKLDQFIPLGPNRSGEHRYTSEEMFRTELAMRDSSDVIAARQCHGVWHPVRDAAPKAKDLGEEQRQAFEHVTSERGLDIVIGYAGTGKSTMLGAAKQAWDAAGYRVRGLALAGIAAQSLQEGAGIESRTLASWFWALEKLPEQEAKLAQKDARIAQMQGNTFAQRKARFEMKIERDRMAARIDAVKLKPRDVIVLDEAGMVGSRDMGKLLSLAEKAGTKVVLVGDAEQLQAIDAGGSFRALTDRHGAVKMTKVYRQELPWQKEAAKNFGDGYAEDALRAYSESGRIHSMATHSDAIAAMMDDWNKARAADPTQTQLMLAYTRASVAELNRKGREAYAAENRLGEGKSVQTNKLGNLEFASGDRMYFLKNSKLDSAEGPERTEVKNGTLGTVESVENIVGSPHKRMTVKLDNGKRVRFTTDDYNDIGHGYAATVHRSQGVTIGRSFVLASQWMNRHAAGVGMTRHKADADMYYSEAEFKTFDGLLNKLIRDGRKDTTLDYVERAEKAGKREELMARTLDLDRKANLTPAERFRQALQMRADPASRKEVERHDEAHREYVRFMRVFSDYPDRRTKSVSQGISL